MSLGVAKHLANEEMVQPLGQVLKGTVLMQEVTVPGWRTQEGPDSSFVFSTERLPFFPVVSVWSRRQSPLLTYRLMGPPRS